MTATVTIDNPAGDKDVDIAGGAGTVQQYLKEGLIDELQLPVVPALLGAGLRLFEGPGAGCRTVEPGREPPRHAPQVPLREVTVGTGTARHVCRRGRPLPLARRFDTPHAGL